MNLIQQIYKLQGKTKLDLKQVSCVKVKSFEKKMSPTFMKYDTKTFLVNTRNKQKHTPTITSKNQTRCQAS